MRMSILVSHVSRFILWGAIGFIWGVGLVSFISASINVILFFVSLLSISVVSIFYNRRGTWCFVFFVLLLGVGAFVMGDSLAKIKDVENNVGKVIDGQAIVVGDIVQKNWNSQITLKYKDTGVTVLIKDEKYTGLRQGSVVELKCETSLPEKYDNFDYQKYLFMKGVKYICNDFEYNVVGFEKSILGELALFRISMENVINNIIPAPQAALANGLLFGGDDRLSENIQIKFAQTGMTHIVAVSGYNVSVIVVIMMSVFIFIGFSRKYAVWIAISSVIFFVALIGFPSSGVRAAIMGIMILVAAVNGRISNAYGAIFFTGAVMIALNPLLFRYDVGFQLSFLSTLGIMAVYPILEKYFGLRNKVFGIVDILLLTISAQIFVLPIIAYHFHTISVLSLLANILVLPIMPITMLLTFFTVVFSFVFYPVAIFFGWLAYFLLAYEIFVIDVLASVPWNSLQVENINFWWFSLYYITVGFSVYFFNRKQII